MHYLQERIFVGVNKLLISLMHYPAGLKLNSELTSFMGQLYIWLTVLFQDSIITFHTLLIHTTFTALVVLCCMGLSFGLAAIADLVALVTFHLKWFNFVSEKFFSWEIALIRYLFQLFRGKSMPFYMLNALYDIHPNS